MWNMVSSHLWLIPTYGLFPYLWLETSKNSNYVEELEGVGEIASALDLKWMCPFQK